MAESGSPMLRPVLSGLAMLAGLALTVWVTRVLGLERMLSEGWFDAHIRGQGLLGVGLFLAVAGLSAAVGLPRQVMAFLGGYVYGFWFGSLLATLGAGLGCMLSYGYARTLGHRLVSRWLAGRLRGRLASLERLLRRSPLSMTMVVRLSPVGNNLLTNLLAGVLALPFGAFVLASLIGYLPQSMVFAMLGSGVQVGAGWRVGLSVVLLVASVALGVSLYRRARLEPQDLPD